MGLIWVTADSLPSNNNSFLLPSTFYINIIKTRSKIIKNLSSAQMSWIESWTTRCQIRQLKQQWAKVEVTVKPLITCWDWTRKSLNLVKALTLPVLLPPWNGAPVEGQVCGHKCGSRDLSLLKKPQTKSSCRFMEWGWEGVKEWKSLGTESDWESFQVRRPPNRDTWARNAAMHKSMAG